MKKRTTKTKKRAMNRVALKARQHAGNMRAMNQLRPIGRRATPAEVERLRAGLSSGKNG